MARVLAAVADEGLVATEPPVALEARAERFRAVELVRERPSRLEARAHEAVRALERASVSASPGSRITQARVDTDGAGPGLQLEPVD